MRHMQARHRDLKGLTFVLGDLTVYSEVVDRVELYRGHLLMLSMFG